MEGVPLPVLDGKSYLLWKMKMQCILEAKGLEEVVYGNDYGVTDADLAILNQATNEDNKLSLLSSMTKSSVFKTKESRAKMMITCALDAKHASLVVACRTSREMWRRIELEYSEKGPLNVESLLGELYTYSKSKNQSISEYLSRLEELVMNLRECGKNIADDAFMVRAISGLPKEYEDFQRSWNLTPTNFRTKNLLLENLRREEKCLLESRSTDIALVARSGTRDARIKKNRKQIIEERKRKGKCGYCKLTGHWWRECPTKPEDWEPEKREKTSVSRNYDKPKERNLCASIGVNRDETTWYLDSGASCHMTGNRHWLQNYRELDQIVEVEFGNGEVIRAAGKGSVSAIATVGAEQMRVRLNDVHYVPNITNNLFSVKAADRQQVELIVKEGKVKLFDGITGELIVTGSSTEQLYKLDLEVPVDSHVAMVARTERTIEEWHKSFGHPDSRQIEKMAQLGCLKGLKIVDTPKDASCGDCQAGRGRRASHPDSSRIRAKEPLERIHMDLVGKVTPASLGGSLYFMLIKDEFTTFMFVHFLTTKAHLHHTIRRFLTDVSTKTQARVKIMRSDNGTEFKNQGVSLLCLTEGIVQEFSSAETPQQNGEAERANRTVIETARTLLQASKLPLSLWEEAVKMAVYLRNLTINRRTGDKTPFELFYGQKPDVSYLLPFGTEVHCLDHRDRPSKFSSKTVEAYIVGMGPRVNTYRCWIPGSKDITITADLFPARHTDSTRETQRSQQPLITFMFDADVESRFDEHDHQEVAPTSGNIQENGAGNDRPNQRANPSIDLPDEDLETASMRTNVSYPLIDEASAYSSCRDNFMSFAHIEPRAPVQRESLQPNASPIVSTDRRVNFDSNVRSIPISTRAESSAGSQVQAPTTSTPLVTAAPSSEAAGSVPPRRSTGTPGGAQVRLSTPAPRGINRSSTIVDRLRDVVCTTSRGRPKRDVKSAYARSAIVSIVANEPRNYDEALATYDAAKWKRAINDELDAHAKNETWEIVPKVKGCTEIPARWVFKIKHNADGTVERFKARLVARGFKQVRGVDYSEIFSPVVRMDSIRLLFSLSAQYDLTFKQFDVTTAFLYGTLTEELYLEPPEGLTVREGFTCRLRKSLYGLRQAPRCWNTKFAHMLKLFNMSQTYADPCVYVATEPDLIYLAIYVDDGLIFAKNEHTINRLLNYLTKNLEVKTVDSACFIGLEIKKNTTDSSVMLHQSGYISRMLAKFNMSDCKPCATPVELAHALNKPETLRNSLITDIPYAEAIGSLLYAAMATRPDLAYGLSVFSKYSSKPRQAHWTAVKRIFRYLKGTMDTGLWYQHVDNPAIVCYTDADWAGNQQNRRSTSGMVSFFNTGPISFKAQQQGVVALSTCEAEYMAAALAVKELVWLRRFIAELRVPISNEAYLMCDNQSAIRLIKNPEFHQRTKHIDIRYHFIREKWQDGTFIVEYVSTDQQKADIFTKSLTSEKHHGLCKEIGCSSTN